MTADRWPQRWLISWTAGHPRLAVACVASNLLKGRRRLLPARLSGVDVRQDLILAPVNKVHHVHTVTRLAEMLGEDEDSAGATW